jgi:hypothetical protein
MSSVSLFTAVSVIGVGGLMYFVLRRDKPGSGRKRLGKGRVAGGESSTKVPAEQRGKSSGLAAKEIAASEANLETGPQHGFWEDNNYCWVVLCKNHWFHMKQNVFYRHRIIIGETDAVSPPPALQGPFSVRCDSCGREYQYKPSDVLRSEAELPEGFKPHPLFQW